MPTGKGRAGDGSDRSKLQRGLEVNPSSSLSKCVLFENLKQRIGSELMTLA